MSQQDVAVAAGLSTPSIQNIERGEKVRHKTILMALRAMRPPLTTEEREDLSQLLEIPPEDVETFLSGEQSPETTSTENVQERMVALLRQQLGAIAGSDRPGGATDAGNFVRLDLDGPAARSLEQLVAELIDRLGVTGTERFIASLLGPMREADRRARIMRDAGQGPPLPPPDSTRIQTRSVGLLRSEEQRRTPDGKPYIERTTVHHEVPEPTTREQSDAGNATKPSARPKAKKRGS